MYMEVNDKQLQVLKWFQRKNQVRQGRESIGYGKDLEDFWRFFKLCMDNIHKNKIENKLS